MARATEAIIDLHALRENYQIAKRAAPRSRAYAVVKANAYGHGLVPVARALSASIDGFAVACIDEAAELREAGHLLPILVLEGPYTQEECQQAVDLDLEITVHREEQVKWIESLQEGRLQVWLKVDTGMHRLGFAVHEIPPLMSRLRNLALVDSIQLMSHFACADEVNHPFNQAQMDRLRTLDPMGLPTSIANSAAIMSLPESHNDLVRPGIMLYGGSPLQGKTGPNLQLQPVMTLQSEIIALHKLSAGDSLGYGQTWQAEKEAIIAVVAIGYGDGYPRLAPNGTPTLIRGVKAPIAGRVSMDMLTVDVSQIEHVAIGDKVTLWGTGLSADEVAQHCQTIAYELFCQVTPRVKMQYLGLN